MTTQENVNRSLWHRVGSSDRQGRRGLDAVGILGNMLPVILSVAEARDRLSELMRRVEAGEAVEIARYNGTPVVRLVACRPTRPQPLVQGCPLESWRTVKPDEPLDDWEENE